MSASCPSCGIYFFRAEPPLHRPNSPYYQCVKGLERYLVAIRLWGWSILHRICNTTRGRRCTPMQKRLVGKFEFRQRHIIVVVFRLTSSGPLSTSNIPLAHCQAVLVNTMWYVVTAEGSAHRLIGRLIQAFGTTLRRSTCISVAFATSARFLCELS